MNRKSTSNMINSPLRPWINFCLIFGGLFLFLVVYCLLSFNNCEEINGNMIERARNAKYITCTYDLPGGLGNQIWRMASLYGMARTLKREPYMEIQPANARELTNIFPHMMEVMHVKPSLHYATKLVPFSPDCCKFDNPRKLKRHHEKYLKLSGNYLQSYKYFDQFKDEIKVLFECGHEVRTRVDSSRFASDGRHRMCIHTRVGDFVPDKLLESKNEFVEPAVAFAFEYVSELIGGDPIVLGMFGDDIGFMKELNFSNVPFAKVYPPSERLRGDDFCLASRHCNSFVMTASGSTFAWWIGYLLDDSAPIFYNAVTSDSGNFSKDVHDFDIFPENWIKLMFDKETGQVARQTLWWYQRMGRVQDIDLS